MPKHRNWTENEVAQELERAVITIQRLPPMRINGYAQAWPEIVRSSMEAETKPMRLPATPEMIAALEQVFGWIQWLTVEERKLLWRKAEHVSWKIICRHLGCDRTTAWRMWKATIRKIVLYLNVWQ